MDVIGVLRTVNTSVARYSSNRHAALRSHRTVLPINTPLDSDSMCFAQRVERSVLKQLAVLFKMDNNTWALHANPWSVYTRYATLPPDVFVIYFRTAMGHAFWPLIAALSVSLWHNPRAFPKPTTTKSWASRAVLGERVLLNKERCPIPDPYARDARKLAHMAGVSKIPLIDGLIYCDPFFTRAGLLLVNVFKTLFLNRMTHLYQDMANKNPMYRTWLYG